ncbi:MAG: SpoIID/LytB domain-containing protein [Acidimicrobiales bacterium]
MSTPNVRSSPRPCWWRRPGRLLLIVLGLALATPPAASAAQPAPEPGPEPVAEPTVVIDGRGWGHGVGMAQDGALALGREGASTEDILQHFYPGTTMGQGGGELRVVVAPGTGDGAVVSFPGGGEVRSSRDGPQGRGFPLKVAPGGSVRLRFDGAYRAEPVGGATVAAQSVTGPAVLDAPAAQSQDGGLLGGLIGGGSSTTAPPPPPPPPPTADQPSGASGPAGSPAGEPAPPSPPAENVATSGSALWAVPARGATVGVPSRSATYRGVIQASAAGDGIRLVNLVDVEQYLRGMGEVRDSSWPRASLGAQAVAARTYALRAVAGGGELCDTQNCQVYLGQQAEYPAMDAAVVATEGQVVRAGGSLADTVYSASGGGISATPEEGFGTSGAGLSYLRAVSYPTDDPQAWDVRMPLAQFGRRLGYPGTLDDVRISAAGPSERALTVELLGDAGSREVSGLGMRDQLGLRSTLWSLRVERPPAPPPVPAATTGASTGDFGRRRPLIVGGPKSGRPLMSGSTALVATETGLPLPLRAASGLVAGLLLAGLYGALAFRASGRHSPQVAPGP